MQKRRARPNAAQRSGPIFSGAPHAEFLWRGVPNSFQFCEELVEPFRLFFGEQFGPMRVSANLGNRMKPLVAFGPAVAGVAVRLEMCRSSFRRLLIDREGILRWQNHLGQIGL